MDEIVIIILGALLLISYIILIILAIKIRNLRTSQKKLEDFFLGETVEQVMYRVSEDNKFCKDRLSEIEKEIEDIKGKQNRSIDSVKLVRYPAPGEGEAKLSYSVGISNKNGDGLVITGLYYRNGVKTYYKILESGNPDYELSEEEKKVISRNGYIDK